MSNLNKMIFLTSLTTGTIIAISSYSGMAMWMGLEINLLAFIPLISSTNNMMNSEAALKYFITQALASAILLFSIIYSSLMMMYNTEMNNLPNLMMNTALLTKMGAATFHFWFPEVIVGISWMNSQILLTWQKIAPLIILSYINKTLMLMSFSIIFCMLISGLMIMNQNWLRKIIAYSSINHLLTTSYFSIYFITTMSITLILNKMNIFLLSQLFISTNYSTTMKFVFSLNFLSLGGLPPFLGFLPKWLVIQEMISHKMILIPFMMIILTLIVLFFYLQISLSILILSSSTPKFYKQSTMKQTLPMTMNLITATGSMLCTLMFNFN